MPKCDFNKVETLEFKEKEKRTHYAFSKILFILTQLNQKFLLYIWLLNPLNCKYCTKTFFKLISLYICRFNAPYRAADIYPNQ